MDFVASYRKLAKQYVKLFRETQLVENEVREQKIKRLTKEEAVTIREFQNEYSESIKNLDQQIAENARFNLNREEYSPDSRYIQKAIRDAELKKRIAEHHKKLFEGIENPPPPPQATGGSKRLIIKNVSKKHRLQKSSLTNKNVNSF